jgi:rhodanese-related sulfurtransferase
MEEQTEQTETTEAGSSGETVSPEQARQMLGSNEASAIDIRGDGQWRNGHLPAARHCPDGDFEDALERIGEEQTVIVACEDGEESARVAGEIREQGREAVSLAGGMDAWRSDDMPMQPSRDPEEDAAI